MGHEAPVKRSFYTLKGLQPTAENCCSKGFTEEKSFLFLFQFIDSL